MRTHTQTQTTFKRTLTILTVAFAALALTACAASDVELDYASEYEAGETAERGLVVDGPEGDYSYLYTLTEAEMGVLIEDTLADGPEGADFESESALEIEPVDGAVEYDYEAESDKGELEFTMETDDGELEYDIHAELDAYASQQLVTRARTLQRERAEAILKEEINDAAEPVLFVVLHPAVRDACRTDLPEAFFNVDSAKLTANARTELSNLAACMNQGALAGETIEVVGHTDPRGQSMENFELGLERARSVEDYLVKQGVEASRIETVSVGELYADEDLPVLWPVDRRVEIRIDS